MMYRRTCIECGKELATWHSRQQICCSATCRQRRSRRQRDQQSAHVVIERELFKMRDGIKRREALGKYREQLLHLKDEINDLLLLANEADAVARREMLEARARRRW